MKKIGLIFAVVGILLLAYERGQSHADSPRMQNPENDHWYQRFDTSMSWHAAKAFCEDIGGYLATITSQEENDFVYNNLGSNSPQWCWLGATDEEKEGVWEWVTGEPWNYTNWGAGEPNNCSGIENYLIYFTPSYPRAGSWNDLGSLNNGGCGCGCPEEYYSMSTICEWDNDFSGIEGFIYVKGIPLDGATITLKQPGKKQQYTTTDGNGKYEFENVVSGKTGQIVITLPKVP